MVNERYQVHANTVTKGEHIGYITCLPDGSLCLEWRVWEGKAPQTKKNYVYPETIKPIKVMVICETIDEQGEEYEFAHYRCPNCGNILHQHYRKSKEPMRYKQNYCHDCGMALDWPEQHPLLEA